MNLISSLFGKIINRASTKKLFIFYTLFIILPMLLVDGMFVSSAYRYEKTAQEHLLENQANAIHYTFFNQVDQAAKLGNAIYTSMYVDNFLTKEYTSNLDFYNSRKSFFDNTLLQMVESQSGLTFTFYIDNDTITNGAEFQKIDQAYDMDWYKWMKKTDLNKGLVFGSRMTPEGNDQRKIYYYQRLNYYGKDPDNFVVITIDYSKCNNDIANLNYGNPAYICDDKRILLTNGKYSNVNKKYSLKAGLNPSYVDQVEVYGQTLYIEIVNNNKDIVSVMRARWYQFLLLAVVNIILPFFVAGIIYAAYQAKLKEQENVMAKKNAELLALHSQINPHFLFNALESIRMHALIKQENETSEMVGHLAKLQRQYTEWSEDSITIEKEIEFVDSYLRLQKDRFGDRLSFEIDVADECKNLFIPKLSLVTFVENACVHGIESKIAPGWIFVRSYIDRDTLIMEVEDTGNGIDESIRLDLLNKMRSSSISTLKDSGRVGIVNACLRLKMISDDEVLFDLDSEVGTGTLVQICIPVKYVKSRGNRVVKSIVGR